MAEEAITMEPIAVEYSTVEAIVVAV